MDIDSWNQPVLSPNARYIVTNKGVLYDTHSNQGDKLCYLWQNYDCRSFAFSPDWSKIAFLEVDANNSALLRITPFSVP